MKVITARYVGFCPGVKRAWSLVEETAKKNSHQTYILGELIHNKQAVEKLGDWGIKTINNLGGVKDKRGVVIVRTHGEPPQTYQQLKKLKLKFVDATCPNVIKIQKLARQLNKEGFLVVIGGKKDHPEAQATLGYAKKGFIVESLEDAKKIPPQEKIGFLAQTTFSPTLFSQIAQILKKKAKVFKTFETFCQITHLAQKEAQKTAKKVDLMVVVGGRNSANTKRLVEACQGIAKTYYIETAQELKKGWFKGTKKVGLTAGASTPDWIIEEVKNKIKNIND